MIYACLVHSVDFWKMWIFFSYQPLLTMNFYFEYFKSLNINSTISEFNKMFFFSCSQSSFYSRHLKYVRWKNRLEECCFGIISPTPLVCCAPCFLFSLSNKRLLYNCAASDLLLFILQRSTFLFSCMYNLLTIFTILSLAYFFFHAINDFLLADLL